ncbi:DUF2515 family protein [Bacillus sp. FJAT-50079]|uniref:DUF2515 family protein n=1 Tax=Bacillus sp. FJAT-50079 TaxID=2833577 RepID=UPI001BC9C922|nr:DUF2515 family protein [Bacillus sp. FJAT-50079]MBS4207873.1 DUF2515 family protein [Bacillus sp. FJAT-50079]
MIIFFKKKQGSKLTSDLLEIKSQLQKRSVTPIQTGHIARKDRHLLEQIRVNTRMLNINNVTRTKAYLDFYRCFPEIHWAFLGHMVSRNGGWNMTDLKGDLLSRLMNEQTKQSFFSFLERGNWLIFQDVYPQFLLYAESMRRHENLFYLLPHLNVSLFMEVIWNHFLVKRDHYMLAIALVINEQSYLEERVVQHHVFKEQVFHTLEFMLQDLLSLNHILFPFQLDEEITCIGLTLHRFGSLHERIMLGKRLYRLLFQDPEQKERILRWAITHPHTGSRKDYWKNLFNDVNEGVPGVSLKRRLKDCQLKKGAPKIYSPRLEYAWANVAHPAAEVGDWYTDWPIVHYLIEDNESINGEIVGDYCETLENLELVGIAKKAIFS